MCVKLGTYTYVRVKQQGIPEIGSYRRIPEDDAETVFLGTKTE